MALLLDQIGKVVKKSSLLFEEADEVLDDKDILKKLEKNIRYTIQNEALSAAESVGGEKIKKRKPQQCQYGSLSFWGRRSSGLWKYQL